MLTCEGSSAPRVLKSSAIGTSIPARTGASEMVRLLDFLDLESARLIAASEEDRMVGLRFVSL
jgi:hypothetical protein